MKPTIYIHHDGYTLNGKHLETVNAQHRNERYPRSSFGYYTFYQHFIERDGTHIQTRPNMDNDVVYKDVHRNSISICLAGNFDSTIETQKQAESLVKLFTTLRKEYGVNAWNIKEHRDYQNTSCPGSLVPKGYFRLVFISSQYSLPKAILFRLLLQLRGMA